MKKIGLLSFLLIFPLFLQAQLKAVYLAPPKHIGGLRATGKDYPYVIPFVATDETFFVQFDDLEGDEKNYYYRIRRYDEHWHPSDLLPQEYIDGYDSDMIQNQENSRATTVSYTHYFFKIPNENTRIKLSGNYLIEILDEDENPVFNIPLVVYEHTVNVAVQARRTNDPATLTTHHFIEFSIFPNGLQPLNPATDLRVILLRNENLFDARVFGNPTFVLPNELRYREPARATLLAGNEFLSFESRDLRGYNRGVAASELKEFYEFYLPVYFPRRNYLELHDIDGSFLFDSFQGRNNKDLESDYVRVHFRLNKSALPDDGRAYVVGRWNNWQTTERYRLKPVEGENFAETVIPLKQGYYDYYYVGRKPDGSIDWTAVTPSFYETENRYTVLVYYRPPGARYTRVVGLGQAVSKPLK